MYASEREDSVKKKMILDASQMQIFQMKHFKNESKVGRLHHRYSDKSQVKPDSG